MATLLITKKPSDEYSFILNGDSQTEIINLRTDLTVVGGQCHFKTSNGANLIKEQNIMFSDVTLVASGTFTFVSVFELFAKLKEIGFFDWINGLGVGGTTKFSELDDTFGYFGKAGQAVVVSDDELSLDTISIYNYRKFVDLEDTFDAIVPNKMLATNSTGTGIILKDLPENQVTNLPFYNKITAKTGFTLVGLDLTINPLWAWTLQGIDYTNTDSHVKTFVLSQAGLSRFVYVIPNSNNGFDVIEGQESVTPIAPQIPYEGVYVTYLLITDTLATDNGEPDLSDYATINYSDAQDLLKVDKVDGERLINASEIVKLGNQSGVNTGDQDLSGYYNKTEVDNKLVSVYIFKGSVANFASLPSTNLTIGDVYDTADTGANYAWNGSAWDTLGIFVDISGKVDKVAGERLINASEITKLGNQSGTNTGDETLATIKTKLGVTILSGSNTGDQDLSGKVDKITGSSLLSDTEITRLGTLANYTHPANHAPSIITQDPSNRFVTDAEKATWNAKQAALGFTPYNATNPNGYETPTQLNARDTNNRARVNHTGTQLSSTISDLQTTISNNTAVAANTIKRSYPSVDETKLAGIAAGATANSTDAQLRDRTTHTGAQAISTVTGLQTALDSKQANLGYTAENVANKNIASGYAGLGTDGKLLSSLLPDITISDTFVTASQAAMLALTAQTGDVSVRTDLNKSFILKINDPTVLTNWQELLTPTSAVTTVFGRNGSITAQSGDYNADQITETASRVFQTPTQRANNDATSSIQTQLNGKQASGSYETAFTKNTAFNKNFGTTAGTVVEGGTLGTNAYNSIGYLPLTGGTLSGSLIVNSSGQVVKFNSVDTDGSYVTISKGNVATGYIGSGYHLLTTPNNNSDFFVIRAENRLDLSVAGPISMTLVSGGNVGIGTTTPNYKLEVNGTFNATGAASFSSSVTSNQYVLSGVPNFTISAGNGDSGTIATSTADIITHNGLGIIASAGNAFGVGARTIAFDARGGNIVARGSVTASSLKATNLSGTGTRTVVADASGNLSATTTPASVGYKVYTALLTQTGTAAPTAIVLENTLSGAIVWSRNSVGLYKGTLSGAFTADKTVMFLTAQYGGYFINGGFETINNVNLGSQDAEFGGSQDGILNKATIEIRVYN